MSLWTYRATVHRVVDGDTIDFDIDLGFYVRKRVRARLAGIDTPEIYGVRHDSEEYKAGIEASVVTRHLLPVGSQCRLTTEKTGKYGRWIAHVTNAEGIDVNSTLIDHGYGDEP